MDVPQVDDVVNIMCEDGVGDTETVDYGDVVELTEDDILRKVFRSKDDAYEFYKKLGKFYGFGIRRGDMFKDEEGNLVRRRFFCNREGQRDKKHYNRVDRKRPHKPKTRTNCEVRMCVYLDKERSLWRVKKVILNHNHEMTHHEMVHLIPSFRYMTDATKAQIEGFQGCGISTSKTMRYMAGISGGYSLVGFLKKDAYNYVDKRRCARIADGDANAAIVYLEGKVDADPTSMARYNVTENEMLANLFWADGGNRIDYQYFGDVLEFDSTYRKNKYKRPLVIFLGCNNHKQTCIFGFGLVLDESIASYTWLLENFLEVMCNRQPSVVVTDGDDSIREAVRVVFPNATHRLCAWHFEKNVTSNVKDENLRQLFNRWIYADMTVEDFEAEWVQAEANYCLKGAVWWNQVYGKEMWANTFLCEKFCAGYRTTSRCEGINSVCKNFLESKHSMLDLVQNLELLVREYRNNELMAQFRSIYSVPVMTTSLESLEHHAASIYTRAIFGDVKKEIESVASVNFVRVKRSLTTKVYTVEEYGRPGLNIMVLCDKNMGKLECRCKFWRIQGYPCKHMFFVMKHEHLLAIPGSLVLKRWTKEAKALEAYVEKTDDNCDRGFLLRHGALHSASRWLFFLGAQKISLFTVALDGIRSLCATLESEFLNGVDATNSNACGELRDPIVVRTKGAPKRQKRKASKRKCATCNKPGHTKRTCREGRPRKGKRPRQDELHSDLSKAVQRDECANLDVIGSDDQRIVEEEGFAGRSVGMSRVDSMTTVAFGKHYGQNSFSTEDVVGPCQQLLLILVDMNYSYGYDVVALLFPVM
ncbi:protein FAR1-RELATED SEQUENCE 5-like [Arachis stenosperma]|uniref:protein FAR1-RELATED SEQUENCE 5-like n=1 Tax=Arachis stenosperma TaxID=217475 RepID=UPI0025AD08DD|nr:protein FAR1-RELATED SEQUENCE 5-like [Arachis stenosperma]